LTATQIPEKAIFARQSIIMDIYMKREADTGALVTDFLVYKVLEMHASRA
jgi:hypothetical protein